VRSSSQKGGTIIAEDVTDRATHERRLCDPDGYRPAFCPRCRWKKLHVHDYRERKLLSEAGPPVAQVVRHVCVGCAAIWQVLPALIARHLWRTWRVVEHTLSGAVAPLGSESGQRWPRVSERTRRRWRARWRRPARCLAQVLVSSGGAVWAAVAGKLRPEATCAELVAAYVAEQQTPAGQRLAAVAALLYRLQPKVRLV
jgi:hypothetical protein